MPVHIVGISVEVHSELVVVVALSVKVKMSVFAEHKTIYYVTTRHVIGVVGLIVGRDFYICTVFLGIFIGAVVLVVSIGIRRFVTAVSVVYYL